MLVSMEIKGISWFRGMQWDLMGSNGSSVGEHNSNWTVQFIWLVVLTILKKLVNGKDYPMYYGQ